MTPAQWIGVAMAALFVALVAADIAYAIKEALEQRPNPIPKEERDE